MPWPGSLVLLSAIAAATTTLRLAAAAIIAPLRHPLLLAKDLATLDLLSEGRLVVLPTVSWHEPEYRRSASPSPTAARSSTSTSLRGRRPGGRRRRRSRAASTVRRRLGRAEAVAARRAAAVVRVEHAARAAAAAHGAVRPRLEPARPPDATRTSNCCAHALADAGRDLADFELVGGTRGRFPDAGLRRRPRRGARRDPRAGRAGLHVDLHQAVAVPRRPLASRGVVPRGRGQGRALRRVTDPADVEAHQVHGPRRGDEQVVALGAAEGEVRCGLGEEQLADQRPVGVRSSARRRRRPPRAGPSSSRRMPSKPPACSRRTRRRRSASPSGGTSKRRMWRRRVSTM